MVSRNPGSCYFRYLYDEGSALDARRHHRCDDLLIRVAANPESLCCLRKNGRARRTREVAAEYNERYKSRCIRCWCCRDLHQVVAHGAALAWRTGDVRCDRPTVRANPCSQQATRGHKGRIEVAGKMQEPAPFMSSLEFSNVSGDEPIAASLAIEVQSPRAIKCVRARVRTTFIPVAQAHIVRAIGCAVTANRIAKLVRKVFLIIGVG